MKLNGKQPGVNIEPIVLPRGDGDIVLKARAIDSFEEFDQLCPEPTPPGKILAGGQRINNVEDPNYKAAVAEWVQKRMAYMVIKGLNDGTPELEWEDVVLDDHCTWLKYKKELEKAGFSDVEVGRIIGGAMKANCLNEAAIEDARQRFLAGEAQPESA